MVSQEVGFDGGKLLKGRKRFLTVDTLGLVLRVFVTAANIGEREGSKRVLKRVNKMGQAVSRLHTIWVDGGFDGEPFMRWVMDFCHWIVQVVLRPEQTIMFRAAQKTLDCRADSGLALLVSAVEQRLRAITGNIRDLYLSRDDPDYGEAIGVNLDPHNFSNILLHPYCKAVDGFEVHFCVLDTVMLQPVQLHPNQILVVVIPTFPLAQVGRQFYNVHMTYFDNDEFLSVVVPLLLVFSHVGGYCTHSTLVCHNQDNAVAHIRVL